MSKTQLFYSVFTLQLILLSDHSLALAPSHEDVVKIQVVELLERADSYDVSTRERLEFADRAVRIAKGHPSLLFRAKVTKGGLLSRSTNLDEAETILKSTDGLDTTVAETEYQIRKFMYLGMIEFLRENYLEATEEFYKADSISDQFPNRTAMVQNFLGLCLSRLGFPEESLAAFEKSLTMAEEGGVDSLRQNLQSNIARLCLELDQIEKAKEIYENLKPVQPAQFQYVSIQSGLAELAIREERFKDARLIVEETFDKHEPRFVESFQLGQLHWLTARSYQGEKNWKAAEAACERALTKIKTERRRQIVLIELGKIKIGTGNVEAGLEIVRDVAGSTANRRARLEAVEFLVEFFEQKKEYQNAFEFLKLRDQLNQELRIAELSIAQSNFLARYEVSQMKHLAAAAKADAERAGLLAKAFEEKASAERTVRNLAIVGALLAIGLSLVYFRTETKRKQAQTRLEESEKRAELQQRLERKRHLEAAGQLVGNVAHDFNNLLQVFSQHCELLKNQNFGGRQSDQRANFDALENSLLVGSKITEQLLSFSNKQEAEPTKIQLSELFAKSSFLIKSVGGDAIETKVCLENPDDSINVDPSQFSNAILNLLLNARDAMESGIIEIRVSKFKPSSEQSDSLSLGIRNYAKIDVVDSGCGMNSETATKAFEPFFSTKTDGMGTGLGLSSVKGFVQQAGGEIAVDSQIGSGTTVSLYFPLAEQAVNASLVSKNSVPAPKSRSASKTCLLVENEASIRESLMALLVAEGYSVSSFEQADLALVRLKEGQRFDVMVSDVVMPGDLDGIQLAHWVHQNSPNTKIALVSGDAAPDPSDTFFEFLRKPFKIDELRQAISAVSRKKLLSS